MSRHDEALVNYLFTHFFHCQFLGANPEKTVPSKLSLGFCHPEFRFISYYIPEEEGLLAFSALRRRRKVCNLL